MKLTTTWGKTYDLEVYRATYWNNKPYIGLIDKKDGELFADLSINPEFEQGDNEIIINKDFENCFKNGFELYNRIKSNFNIKSRGINNGYHCFTF